RAKQVLTAYEDMAELIRLGAYRKGSDPAVDEAIKLYPPIEEFLRQNKDEQTSIDEGFARMNQILGAAKPNPAGGNEQKGQ
ncbi:MAG: flagellum-specific ATP synthase FliI, partial [Pseudomonadota bacterium]|nr:flagellum-specific ATP synthase FliI [Pseudomonadota bacterium]